MGIVVRALRIVGRQGKSKAGRLCKTGVLYWLVRKVAHMGDQAGIG